MNPFDSVHLMYFYSTTANYHWQRTDSHRVYQIILSLDSIVVFAYNNIRILLSGGSAMNIRPSAAIRQNYNEIADLCRKSMAPVYLTKNGEGDLVVMDIVSFTRREKMLELRENLLAVEEDRVAGRTGCTVEELDRALSEVLGEV